MTFFFSFPQTLLRQLSIDFDRMETEYVFVFESSSSPSGRDNRENFEISKEILKLISPKATLLSHNEKVPPEIKMNDGIAEELLRLRSYDWIINAKCRYLVQHSCFGWESINAKALLYPRLFLRAIRRTKKLHRRNRFDSLYVFAGQKPMNLRYSIKPWKKVSIIIMDDLAKVCKKASAIPQLQPRQKLDQLMNKAIVIIASGDLNLLYQDLIHRPDLLDYQIFIKQHPQQESRLPDTLDPRTHVVSNRNVPAELVIEKYEPELVYGVKSTVQYYFNERYVIYTPLDWRYSQESNLLAEYRMAIEQPLSKDFCDYSSKFSLTKRVSK